MQTARADSQTENGSTTPVPFGASSAWLIPLIVAVATVAAFLPAIGNQFVSWDDAKNFVDNPHYRGLGWSHLKWMWTTFHMGHYVPLTWMTLGLDYSLWGMNPAGYHATNLLLHAANAVVLYFIARRLFALAAGNVTGESSTRFALAAAIAALVFAIHPLRVESVAWITERRDMLSLLFFLSSISAYLRFASSVSGGRRLYWLSLAAFLCALLSKATVITLPAVLLLLNLYPLRRVGLTEWRGAEAKKVALELAPFAALAAAAAILSVVALHPPEQLPLTTKVAVAAYSLAFYLWKSVIPTRLSPLYEMPHPVDPLQVRFVLSFLLCVGLAAGVLWGWRRWRGAAACLIGFVIIALPMLGFVQNGPQIAADRYTYHAGPALGILFGALALRASSVLSTSVLRAFATLILITLGTLSLKQTSIWRDSETLWTHALSLDSTSAIAHSAMANVRFGQDRVEEGIEHSRRAAALAPLYPEAYNDLGVGFTRENKPDSAEESFRRAIELQGNYDEALNNLGVAIVRRGDIASGIELFQRALAANPDYADAHVNWGNALVRSGRQADAIPHYQAALAIRPADADAYLNWGVALAQQTKFGDAA
ncbi:MAG TPA: tetratricopeptide repeat protein, partial [Gemmatimonadaceae bacterium]